MLSVPRIRRTVDVGRATISLAQSEQITFLAAAIAYYAFASIVPLVVLSAVLASIVGGEALATDIVEFLGSTLTPASQDVLLSTLTTTTGRGSATLVGVIALAWSSLKVFRALDTAFSIVYGGGETPGFLEAVVDGVVAFGAVALAIGVSVGVVAALAFVDVPYVDRLGFLLEVFVLAAAFYPLYYLFPGVDVAYREAVPGAVLAALGWTTFSGLFQLYAENAANLAVWGVLGVALVVVTWLYVGSLLLLVGATVNAVLADRALPAVESADAAAVDRQLQSGGLRQTEPAMGDDDRDGSRDVGATDERRDVDDVDAPADEPGGAGADESGVAADEPGGAGADESGTGGAGESGGGGGPDDSGAGGAAAGGEEPDAEALRAEVEELREQLAAFEDDVEDRTLHRDDVERDLKRYVRRRVRRGKARGWGPYLVLLYGTVMTLGAFYTPFLTGGWAIFAMIVIWLSTLGLYALMLLVGLGVNAISVPGRVRDAVGDWRS